MSLVSRSRFQRWDFKSGLIARDENCVLKFQIYLPGVEVIALPMYVLLFNNSVSNVIAKHKHNYTINNNLFFENGLKKNPENII